MNYPTYDSPYGSQQYGPPPNYPPNYGPPQGPPPSPPPNYGTPPGYSPSYGMPPNYGPPQAPQAPERQPEQWDGGNPFNTRERLPSISWGSLQQPVSHGTRRWLTVYDVAYTFHARNYQTRELEYWPDGGPKWTVSIPVLTEDGSKATLTFGRSSAMASALNEAFRIAGVAQPARGGIIDVTYTHDRPDPANPRNTPSKQFSVIYIADGTARMSPQQERAFPYALPQPPAPQRVPHVPTYADDAASLKGRMNDAAAQWQPQPTAPQWEPPRQPTQQEWAPQPQPTAPQWEPPPNPAHWQPGGSGMSVPVPPAVPAPAAQWLPPAPQQQPAQPVGPPTPVAEFSPEVLAMLAPMSDAQLVTLGHDVAQVRAHIAAYQAAGGQLPPF